LVLERSENNKHRKVVWLCVCECGNKVSVIGSQLRNGNTVSCGCYQKAITKQVLMDYRNKNKGRTYLSSHEMSRTSIYKLWHSMIMRCYKVERYVSRGISVCPRWLNSFEDFYLDMGDRPHGHLTLDRIDNNGNYSPDNCRWATRKEQANNTRSNRNFSINGQTKTLQEWCEYFNIRYTTVRGRLARGMPIEKALTTRIQKKGARLQW